MKSKRTSNKATEVIEADVETSHSPLRDCINQCVGATNPITKEAFKCKKCGNTKHAPHTWPKYCPMCGAKVEVNQDRN